MKKQGRKKDSGTGEGAGGDGGGLRWMSAGIEFCGVIAIFCYIGYRLDRYFGFEIPFMLMTGFFIGFIGMLYLFYKDSK